MQIVGAEDTAGVHTIDVWFSQRRRCWVMERLDAEGHLLGQAFCSADEGHVGDCLAEWLRTHGETHLLGREIRSDMMAPADRSRAA